MIVSASYRTDIPAFYARWFRRRLAAGRCAAANPYGSGTYEVSLRAGEVDGFVFWTRNIGKLLPDLDAVRRVAPFVVQFTVTGYPRALEASVIAPEDAVAQLRELRDRFGPRVAVWRYDPIVFAGGLDPGLDQAAHLAGFAALACRLSGTVDEVVLSVVHPYRKTRRNLDRAAARAGFVWRDPPDDEKRDLLRRLAAIAREQGIAPTLCSQPDLLVPDLGEARCIDAARLKEVGMRPVAARERGNRLGCHCAESRDIGAYDTCLHGCVYCYAVADRNRTVANFRAHDPDAARLFG